MRSARRSSCGISSRPISDNTFQELANKGVIVPFKRLRSYFKLNESLRRMGLKDPGDACRKQDAVFQ
jgi:hypothetical protein